MARLRLFDMLPATIQTGDPDNALKALMDAIDTQMTRERLEIGGLAVLIDAHGLNRTFVFEGKPTFDFVNNPEQLVLGTITSPTTVQITSQAITSDDFFRGYGLRVLRKNYDGNNDGVFEEDNNGLIPDEMQSFYTRITGYNGQTKVATVSPEFPDVVVGSVAFELCYPQFLYLPAVDAKGRAVSLAPNYYRDWYVRIIGGPGSTPIQTRRITNYFVKVDVNNNPIGYILSTDTPWDFSPAASSLFGITTNFVSLNYLAKNVGFDLDATDPEELQRQQILNAVSLYKMKGTRRAMQRLFRTFGFDAQVEEVRSNFQYTPTDTIGVQEPAKIETRLPVAMGTPSNIRMVNVNSEFEDDFDYTDPAMYFSKWDDVQEVGTLGHGEITMDGGQAQITLVDANDGAYLMHNMILNFERGSVVEFDFQIFGTIPNGTTVELLRWTNPAYPTDTCSVGIKNQNRQFYYNGGTPAVATTLGDGDTSTHRLRVWGNPSGGSLFSVGITIELDGTIIAEDLSGFMAFSSASQGAILELRFGAVSTGASFNNPYFVMHFDHFRCGTPTNELIASGGGEDDLRALAFRSPIASGILDEDDPSSSASSYRPNSSLRVPDSKVLVFLRRLHPQVRFSQEILPRLRARLEDIRPAHVEVAIIGIAVEDNVSLSLADDMTLGLVFSETLVLTDDVSTLPGAYTFDESLVLSDVFELVVPGTRWDRSSTRWDKGRRWDR